MEERKIIVYRKRHEFAEVARESRIEDKIVKYFKNEIELEARRQFYLSKWNNNRRDY